MTSKLRSRKPTLSLIVAEANPRTCPQLMWLSRQVVASLGSRLGYEALADCARVARRLTARASWLPVFLSSRSVVTGAGGGGERHLTRPV